MDTMKPEELEDPNLCLSFSSQCDVQTDLCNKNGHSVELQLPSCK